MINITKWIQNSLSCVKSLTTIDTNDWKELISSGTYLKYEFPKFQLFTSCSSKLLLKNFATQEIFLGKEKVYVSLVKLYEHNYVLKISVEAK